MATADPLDDILTAARLQPDTLVRVRRLIQDLRAVLGDYGIDKLLDSIGSDDCPIRDVMRDGSIVVIPGRGQGSCAPIVLALARGRDGRSPQGVPSVMREVRAHVITCFEMAEVVLLLTDRWDPDLLRESVPDFKAHAARPVARKVLIPLVGWKAQLTAYPWP